MSDRSLARVYLARHGQTRWSISGQHTGLTDLPLTEAGEHSARRLGARLKDQSFAAVFASPLRRAAQTCELAGFGAVAMEDADLAEWNYGAYEGKTTAEIQRRRPGWEIFRDGCPGGERLVEVAARAERVISKVRQVEGDVLLFSHGHFLRVFAACWIGLDPAAARTLYLGTGALSILGYEHGRDDPVIRLWNDRRHALSGA